MKISVVEEDGYVLFKVGNENIVAYQRFSSSRFVLIAREGPSRTLTSATQASKAILTILFHAGGDVKEFCQRPSASDVLPKEER